jgi:hypothetical protein
MTLRLHAKRNRQSAVNARGGAPARSSDGSTDRGLPQRDRVRAMTAARGPKAPRLDSERDRARKLRRRARRRCDACSGYPATRRWSLPSAGSPCRRRQECMSPPKPRSPPLPQPRFVLIGSGPLEGKVAAQIKRHGLQGPLPPPRHLPARRDGFPTSSTRLCCHRGSRGAPIGCSRPWAEVPVRRQGSRDQFKQPCGRA